MSEVERIILNAILGMLSDEQREAMALAILAQSGRGKVDPNMISNDPRFEAEDDAIEAIKMGFLA